MKYASACMLLLLAGVAAGQSPDVKEPENELVSQLMNLQHADGSAGQTEVLTSSIIALAEREHEPSRWAVAALARALTNALGGRATSAVAANRMAKNISEVLRSAGTGTADVAQAISTFRSILSGMGASAMSVRTVVATLTDVASEVRGPQDTPRFPPR
jgi:hypothetical protein